MALISLALLAKPAPAKALPRELLTIDRSAKPSKNANASRNLNVFGA